MATVQNQNETISWFYLLVLPCEGKNEFSHTILKKTFSDTDGKKWAIIFNFNLFEIIFNLCFCVNEWEWEYIIFIWLMFAGRFDPAYFYGPRQLYRSKMKTFLGFMLECFFLHVKVKRRLSTLKKKLWFLFFFQASEISFKDSGK